MNTLVNNQSGITVEEGVIKYKGTAVKMFRNPLSGTIESKDLVAKLKGFGWDKDFLESADNITFKVNENGIENLTFQAADYSGVNPEPPNVVRYGILMDKYFDIIAKSSNIVADIDVTTTVLNLNELYYVTTGSFGETEIPEIALIQLFMADRTIVWTDAHDGIDIDNQLQIKGKVIISNRTIKRVRIIV